LILRLTSFYSFADPTLVFSFGSVCLQQLQDDTIRLRIRNVLGLLGFEGKFTESMENGS